ncbi:hypothetical protein LY76DRAFT_597044 [Colletotrichum caudatum]|nr:hypothetical protein LY76DRAFT_597044 [Colletotrichum caudatum]
MCRYMNVHFHKGKPKRQTAPSEPGPPPIIESSKGPSIQISSTGPSSMISIQFPMTRHGIGRQASEGNNGNEWTNERKPLSHTR